MVVVVDGQGVAELEGVVKEMERSRRRVWAASMERENGGAQGMGLGAVGGGVVRSGGGDEGQRHRSVDGRRSWLQWRKLSIGACGVGQEDREETRGAG
ncbi:uncharacterized protein A4U43_C02F11230 [Asparagus officinalis]|uniref:Uncharacterized protein n=1 Tax=Asparagus officinalis TaxID=4686 RepID=A0A5P1FHP2_ASPOF|nr:uncharacterized protein A4U43_C02F11230 [Asparagus officinalis]